MKAATHRHSAGHEHDFEPMRGLPEMLPADEHILWQGSPDWRSLAVRAFHLRKLAVYFSALLLLRAGLVMALDGGTVQQALRSLLVPGTLALLALALVATLAWLSARTSVYTITDKRVVMRVGIVLTLAFNLPYARVAAADLKRGASNDVGDIALTLSGGDRIAWLNLWPHARPWQVARPQPTLRCVPQATAVAQQLCMAWAQATGHAVAGAAQPVRADAAGAVAGGVAVGAAGRSAAQHQPSWNAAGAHQGTPA